MAASVEELVAAGSAALRAGDVEAARTAFAGVPDPAASGHALEGLARIAYLELAFPLAVARWEEAYTAHRRAEEHLGTIRVARTLGYMYFAVIGDRAVAGGWIARAETLLGQVGPTAEAGWVALNSGMFEGDRARKEDKLRQALAVARSLGDVDLEVAALGYLGASLVHGDRTEEGMLLLDEALAVASSGEIDDVLVLEEVFCQLFSACEHAHDVARADAWIRVGELVAERRHLPAVSAFCRTHYGGLLTAAGRWPEADALLTEAVRLWGLGRRSYLRGGALLRLAELRVGQGRVEEAERLLEELDVDAFPEAAGVVAAVHLAKGEVARAVDVLERALAQADPASTTAAPILALLVDAHLAAGDAGAAGEAAEHLAACADHHPSEYLTASAALARGRVCLALGTGDPQACLRDALAGFARAQLPMEIARSRLELAGALATDRPEVALAEARAALDAFERLQAARHVDAATAVLRTLGVRPTTARRTDGVLTAREADVLELLGHGLTNPEIATRLYISRKTVEHHVGNVLAKLGLRSRAEAAVFATRGGSGRE